jgi:hypothetical protein
MLTTPSLPEALVEHLDGEMAAVAVPLKGADERARIGELKHSSARSNPPMAAGRAQLRLAPR